MNQDYTSYFVDIIILQFKIQLNMKVILYLIPMVHYSCQITFIMWLWKLANPLQCMHIIRRVHTTKQCKVTHALKKFTLLSNVKKPNNLKLQHMLDLFKQTNKPKLWHICKKLHTTRQYKARKDMIVDLKLGWTLQSTHKKVHTIKQCPIGKNMLVQRCHTM
jgi:predicted DNA-binding protein YlxM (UPF0122 family)